jgi:hypothetical protein
MRHLPTYLSEIYYVHIQGAYLRPNSSEIETKVIVLPIPTSLRMGLATDDPHAEGPFLTLEHVEHSSIYYNLLELKNIERAKSLLLKKIMKRNPDFFNAYFTPDYISQLSIILEHTFLGNMFKREFTGIHFDHSNLKHEKGRFEQDNNGVFKQRVQIYSPIKGAWVSKYNSSTFWPKSWSIEKFIMEVAYSWSNKIAYGPNRKIGQTRDGINVIFYFNNDLLKTVYPVFE